MPKRQIAPETFIDLIPLDRVASPDRMWRDLEGRADGSFFLSHLWIGCWLKHLPADIRPHLLTARRNDRIVGLAVLCPQTIRRFGLLPGRRWLLHETGDARVDRLAIEYNGILADRDCADEVTASCLNWLAHHGDELVLSGLASDTERLARRTTATILETTRTDETHWVDLETVRRAGGDYRAGLGRNTRSAVSRALRLYGQRGAVEYRIAATADEALIWFDALERLHQATWQARGMSGAFDNPLFRPCHRDLIAGAVPSGAVRLCRIAAGNSEIGYLYNFVWRGTVLNYQSGFAYEPDNRLKPGLVSHVLAIEDTLIRGEGRYDFMAGPAGHKPLLSNAGQPMVWLRLTPDSVTRRIESALRRLFRTRSASG
jgi:hypothetical protein